MQSDDENNDVGEAEVRSAPGMGDQPEAREISIANGPPDNQG